VHDRLTAGDRALETGWVEEIDPQVVHIRASLP